ncbi:MAG: helix-turn-helix transcriptional regulator [Flavobacteriales bacterium]|nr:helix-turn-helix transcriptional regulator [Flavobacteriales bacterium]
MGASYLAPKMGAMKKFRLSIYEPEQVLLRHWLIEKRKNVKLTQRQLAERLQVVHSLIGKVEKGERRLDIIEFRTYCNALGIKPCDFFDFIDREGKA